MTSTENLALHRMIDALQAVDQPALERVLDEDVTLRALLPRRDEVGAGRAEVADRMLAWYRDSTGIVRVHDVVDTVGDVWHAGWRFTLREAGTAYTVEQHAYCRVTDGLIGSIRLICSGFRPVGAVAHRADRTLDSLGEGCATLTPRIAAAMRDLAPGQVLSVRTDDPAAPEGIAAWSRLTGHEVIGADAPVFLIRHR
jgi:TusA-related sulfurtransferase/ketosteroid isomerase-like protein